MVDTTPGLEQSLLEVVCASIRAGRPDASRRAVDQSVAQRDGATDGRSRGTPAGKRVLRQLLKTLRAFRKAEGPQNSGDGDHIRIGTHSFREHCEAQTGVSGRGQPGAQHRHTKKKEHLGTFYRDGKLYSRDEVRVYDHDFPSSATGVVIPYGIYDLAANVGHVTLGTSHDTSEFACECLAQWWEEHGRRRYPTATRLLILCDGGGSNGSNRHVFKEQLQHLADRLGLELRVAHYPPYCSKYNPIEHRVFPHVTRACQGVIFESVELVSDLISRTRTQTGLSVTTSILDRVFETGRKVANNFHETCRILRDELLPKWNYRVLPTPPA